MTEPNVEKPPRKKPGPKPRAGAEAVALILVEYNAANKSTRAVMRAVLDIGGLKLDSGALRAIGCVATAARALDAKLTRAVVTTLNTLDGTDQ